MRGLCVTLADIMHGSYHTSARVAVLCLQVYLCLRVLLCRIGNQHLSSFWPIILTELLRLYEQLMSEPSTSSSEYLQLILSACKFLDLLLVLQTEEFQM